MTGETRRHLVEAWEQLRAKVLKWKEERGRSIKRERQWRRELGEIVSDSSDDGDELNRKNDNNQRLNAGVDLLVAEKEVEKEETLTCAAQNKGPEDSPVKAEDKEKTKAHEFSGSTKAMGTSINGRRA